jgi:SOS-response transcriptional repressor LexA
MSMLFHSIRNRTKRPLDLHDLLVTDEMATFFVRIKGNSFDVLGIYAGDILVVDRSRINMPHRYYVAVIDGDFTIVEQGLQYKQECEYWGAVTYVIHKS